MMKTTRILTHGFVLTVCAFVAVWAGAWLRYWAHNNYTVAVIAAVPLTVGLFMTWMLLISRLHLRSVLAGDVREYVWIYVSSLVWGPCIFVPLHYMTQGYLTSIGNLAALFSFQAPVNVLALLSSGAVVFHKKTGEHARGLDAVASSQKRITQNRNTLTDEDPLR